MQKQTKQATLRNVAEKAGVGVSTASYILRGVDTGWSMNKATKKRVFDAAKELNYKPNILARSLVRRKSENIGFLIPDSVPEKWRNQYFSSLLCGAERTAHELGYALIIGRYDESNINDIILPKHVSSKVIDGVILAGYASESVINQFNNHGIICVSAGSNIEKKGHIPIIPDNLEELLVDALLYLTKQGHQRVGWHRRNTTRKEKEVNTYIINKVKNTSAGKNIKLTQFKTNNNISEEEYALSIMQQWLGTPPAERPTAIIMNTTMAQTFINNLYKHDLRCPNDISIIAIGNPLLNKLCYPELTSIDLDLEERGAIVTKLLIHRLTNQEAPTTTDINSYNRFVIRQSCAPPRQYC